MNRILKIFSFFLAFTTLSLFSGCNLQSTQPSGSGNSTEVVTDNVSAEHQVVVHLKDGKSVKFSVELALTEPERERGLMFRTSLPQNSGMLFVYEKPQVLTFWMKNTLIPLDMIFADEQGKILYIYHQVQPCKTERCDIYSSGRPAKYVLEINGGLGEKLGIAKGDVLQELSLGFGTIF